MNTEIDTPSSMNFHLPITLLALAAAVFFGAQIGAVNRGAKTIKWQLENMDKQIANLKDAKKQHDELITKRGDLVKQSSAVQAQYTSLLNDVMDLAKTDADAKKIVEKWGIQRQAPPEGSTPAADDKKAEAKPAESK